MCCFSGTVEFVAQTRIFARFTKPGEQAIVYQMEYGSAEPLAMILPIPVPPKSKEDAVKFIDLKEYDAFFADLKKGFPEPKPRAFLGGIGAATLGEDAPLEVQDVGNFIASFVPTIADFDRLDEKFRLPKGTWEKLPTYKDYGFAVFQLKPEASHVHPMAFTFPTRPKARLFFPTVHIHDGEVHAKAEFDHDLYLQPASSEQMLPRSWRESTQPAKLFVDIKKSKSLFHPELHVYRMRLEGELKNTDTLV
jgi:hypothetical protein